MAICFASRSAIMDKFRVKAFVTVRPIEIPLSVAHFIWDSWSSIYLNYF